ncbi:MAG TPA: LysM peptidoglycan-binding domain-containing protein, partial [Acidobacteriota bacterium]|nr:LysM peptidoglycan-binding domain-containing protein [Acidobacteriota bacterium]
SLASRFGVSVRELQRLNGLSNPHRIYPGQVILVSNGSGTPQRSAPSTVASAVSPPSTSAVQEVHYTVQPGDSLARIASRFETTVQALQQANDLGNPNLLRPGQTLVIHGSKAATSGPVEYTVQRGDTLAQIAQRYQTTPEAIQQANNLRNPNLLRPGQRLIIDGSAVVAPKEYTVQRGDTLGLIARKFGTSVEQIKSANDIRNANRIRQGQQLLIP